MRKPESVANFLVPKNSLLSSAISTTRKQQPYSPIYRNSAFYERYFDSVHQPEHPEQRGFQLSPKMVDMPLHIASKSRLAMRQSNSAIRDSNMVARESIAAIKDINIPSTEVYPRVGIHSTAVTNLAFHLSDLQRQLQKLIKQLKQVHQNLKRQVISLQQTLDITSKSLGNIDKQFLKIKKKILDYTSRSLDMAFSNYKKQMTDWPKYELCEKKGLEVLLQAEGYIKEEEMILDKLRENRVPNRFEENNEQLRNRIKHYAYTANQLKKLKEECMSMHPHIKEQNIRNFENSLTELCQF